MGVQMSPVCAALNRSNRWFRGNLLYFLFQLPEIVSYYLGNIYIIPDKFCQVKPI